MRRRLLGTLAWFLLLLVAGVVRTVWLILRILARPRILLTVVGVGVAVRTSPALVLVEVPTDGIESLGQLILPWAALFTGAVVLFLGLQSPWVWQVRRWILRHTG